jgi:hypothetical protein
MGLPLKSGLPVGTTLLNNYTVVIEAIDPTSGAPVSGVVVTEFTIYADQAGSLSAGDVGNPLLIGSAL